MPKPLSYPTSTYKTRPTSDNPSSQNTIGCLFHGDAYLQENPDLTRRELADKFGISVGGLNYCLKTLVEKDLIKMKNFDNSKSKFGYVYELTPTGMAEKASIAHRFLQRKMDEYKALKAEIEALRSEVDKQGGEGNQKV